MNTLLADIKETRERQVRHAAMRRAEKKATRRVKILNFVNRVLERMGL